MFVPLKRIMGWSQQEQSNTTARRSTSHQQNRRLPYKTWDERYQELVEYHRQFGHVNLKQRDPQYPQLAAWVSRQRSNQKQLSPAQRTHLDQLGFCWEKQADRFDRRWKEMYQRLVAYKDQHGDCLVPQQYDADRELGQWVARQRVYYASQTLREDRQLQLDQLGFCWLARPENVWTDHRDTEHLQQQWMEQYRQLEAFYHLHGHSSVPNTFVQGKNEPLGRWIRAQRSNYVNGTMSPERQALLEKLHFRWRVHGNNQTDPKSMTQQSWDTKFQRLRDFCTVYGHCRVPGDYDDAELAVWVAVQCMAAKEGWLDPWRRQQLESIGFDWKTNATSELLVPVNANEMDADVRPLESVPSASGIHDTDTMLPLPPDKEDSPTLATEKSSPMANEKDEGEVPKQFIKQHFVLGTKVNKFFSGHGWFTGEVVRFEGGYYQVRYTDGDEEEYLDQELRLLVKAFQRKEKKKKTTTATPPSRKRPAPSQATPSTPKRSKKNDGLSKAVATKTRVATPSKKRPASSQATPSTPKRREKKTGDSFQAPAVTPSPAKQSTRDIDPSSLSIGDRIAVYWKSEKEYFDATLIDHRGAKYFVRYDDGDDEWLELRRHQWRRLPPLVKRRRGVGTKVRKYFCGHGWYQGIIIDNDGKYVVRYQDGDEETFELDSFELQSMVAKAKE